MAQINVTELFKQTRIKLKLKWIAGLNGGSNTLTSQAVTKPSLALIGHLNFVHPNRVQVMGCAEMDYLRSLQTVDAERAIANLYSTVGIFMVRKYWLNIGAKFSCNFLLIKSSTALVVTVLW